MTWFCGLFDLPNSHLNSTLIAKSFALDKYSQLMVNDDLICQIFTVGDGPLFVYFHIEGSPSSFVWHPVGRWQT